jgi:hypothetical protein
MKSKIRIANAGGFWGDDLSAFRRQLEGGNLDYLTMDFLAEITMSILRKQQLRNSELGYVTDFIDQIEENAVLLSEKGVKVITNAGGINPLQCGKKIIEILNSQNVNLKVAIVDGDNIVDNLAEYYPDTESFKNLETGESFESINNKVQSANVYLGIPPILKALELGADIVICGRVTDTSITIAPMVYEFGWELNDWDKIASGLIAGHIIECGAQSTGGNFTDWQLINNWDNFGYPIVEVYPDSSFVFTKHENTGGLVSIDTTREQLVYEMGDPSFYISPDVIANFLTIQLTPDGENRVKVSGIKGSPSTKTFKVSMAYEDGYSSSGTIIISGDNAVEKGETFAAMFWSRNNLNFEKTNTELIGFDACQKNMSELIKPNEVLLKLSVYDNDKSKLVEFSKGIAPLILSGPPGVAVTGGRPRIQNVMSYWPALISKELITSRVALLNSNGDVEQSETINSVTGYEITPTKKEKEEVENTNTSLSVDDLVKVKLRDICLARSGDKGDVSNIGVLARSEKIYQFIKEKITIEYIKDLFKDFCKGKVIRYEMDNLLAINFLLEESLDGGGTKSLMIDAQGKTFASSLLNQEMLVPKELLQSINSRGVN